MADCHLIEFHPQTISKRYMYRLGHIGVSMHTSV